MNEKLILRYIKEVDFGLWTRWKLWTTEVLILSLALATDSEQQFNNRNYIISISDIEEMKSKNDLIKLQDIITNTKSMIKK
jgi:hypothetical protein